MSCFINWYKKISNLCIYLKRYKINKIIPSAYGSLVNEDKFTTYKNLSFKNYIYKKYTLQSK